MRPTVITICFLSFCICTYIFPLKPICSYGALVKDMVVLVINISSTLVSLYCVGVYSIFVKIFPWQLYIVCTLVILLGIHFAFHNEIVKIGVSGCILTVLSSLTPLMTIGTVLKDRSTASMPSFSMTITSFITNIVWALYGVLITNDPLVYVPCILCLFPVGVQLAVYTMYPTPTVKQNNN